MKTIIHKIRDFLRTCRAKIALLREPSKIKYISSMLQKLKTSRGKNKEQLPMREFILHNNDKCLILAPHADDESIGVGGLLLKFAKQCSVICLTDGRFSHAKVDPNKTAKIRKAEFENVMKSLKIKDFKWIGIQNEYLNNHLNILDNYNLKKFDYIFVPNFLDYHCDHLAVKEIIKTAINKKQLKKKAKIVFYEIMRPLPIVNTFTNISKIKDKKRKLINLYKSQIKLFDYAEITLGLNRVRGNACQSEYAETYFMVDQSLLKHI